MALSLKEWVEGAGQFQKADLQRCEMAGSCAQCGLCCVAFLDKLPIEIPALVKPVELARKGIMQVCPHLEQEGGKSLCTAHEQKNHPSLQHCRDWRGDQPMKYAPQIRNFDMMLANFWTWIIVDASGEEFLLADEMIEKGLVIRVVATPMDFGTFQRLCRKLLALPRLPHRILNMLRVKEILELSRREQPQLLQKLGKELGLESKNPNPIQREFKEKYWPR